MHPSMHLHNLLHIITNDENLFLFRNIIINYTLKFHQFCNSSIFLCLFYTTTHKYITTYPSQNITISFNNIYNYSITILALLFKI